MALFRRRRRAGTLPDEYDVVADDDRAVLVQLSALGAQLDDPRHVLHYLYVPDHERAEVAAAAAREAGWETDVSPSVAADGTWCVRSERHDHLLHPAQVNEDRALFDRLAAESGGEYDGWEAAAR